MERLADDTLIIKALAALQSPTATHDERNQGCAILWRSLKPTIQAHEIRLARIFPSEPHESIYAILDDKITDLLLDTRATTPGAFFAYAQGKLRNASKTVFTEARRRSASVSFDGPDRGETVQASRYDGLASQGDDPTSEQIEAALVDAIDNTTPLEHHQRILRHFYGLGEYRGRPEPNLSILGKEHGLTGERVRQINERVKRYLYELYGRDEDDGE